MDPGIYNQTVVLVVQVAGAVNLALLAYNAWMQASIKSAISDLRAQIADNRRLDTESMREWVEGRLQQHCEGCAGYSRRVH